MRVWVSELPIYPPVSLHEVLQVLRHSVEFAVHSNEAERVKVVCVCMHVYK